MVTDTKATLAPGLAERERVVARLRELAPRLRARGIRHLSLFGSIARGDAGPESDIDLLIEIDRESHFGLFDLMDLKEDLGDLFGRPVNVAFPSKLRPWLREIIDQDRIEVF